MKKRNKFFTNLRNLFSKELREDLKKLEEEIRKVKEYDPDFHDQLIIDFCEKKISLLEADNLLADMRRKTRNRSLMLLYSRVRDTVMYSPEGYDWDKVKEQILYTFH